ISSQWATQNTTDVSLAGGNVGIGTTLTTTSALTVMNGNVGIGTWIPSSTLNVNGSFATITVSKSSNYTVTVSDNVVLVSGNTTITLPAAASVPGRQYVIKK